jgi:hypothetical protein
VQLLYLEGIMALQDHIIVELVPQGCSRELGTGELGKRTKVDAIRSASNKYEQKNRYKYNGDALRRAGDT